MLIKDDKICKRVIENLGEIIDEGGYGYIYNMINDDKILIFGMKLLGKKI